MWLLPGLLAASPATEASPARTLTFEQRVEAQRAIERVYYSHLSGAERPFDAAVPRDHLENRVRTYLQQSAALAEVWHTPVTGDALRRELDRIAAETRLPERLLEIYAALGHDPFLIEECFARPALVDRLSRSFFASDGSIHAATRAEAEALRASLESGAVDIASPAPRRIEVEVGLRDADGEGPDAGVRRPTGQIDLDTEAFTRWRRRVPSAVGEIGPVVEETDRFSIAVLLEEEPGRARLAVYTVPKRTWDEWWEAHRDGWPPEEVEAVSETGAPPPQPSGPERSDGAVRQEWSAATASPCVLRPAWDNGVLDDPPEGRYAHTAVWTGSVMIVWGGSRYTLLGTGLKYDPVIDTWSPLSTASAPSPRALHTAVWTGSVMIVWGGVGVGGDGKARALRTGGRYDPATDTWQKVTTNGAPGARVDHTAVWTGSVMIVWGGDDYRYYFGNGARYNPVKNTWTAVAKKGAPSARYLHSAVWTGTRMIVWGGAAVAVLSTGASYDPSQNAWTPTASAGAPSGRALHTAVWTGSEMIVWGGQTVVGVYFATGGRYDPAAGRWTPVTTAGAPTARTGHLAVWTGREMIVHGGDDHGTTVGASNGARYDPSTDSWTPYSAAGAPRASELLSAVWTGAQLIIWGGWPGLNSGARYDPDADVWTPTFLSGAPSERDGHAAFWTGTVMLVWGGSSLLTGPLNTGGRYDPLLDMWRPTATAGAPQPRYGTPLWTGDRLVVWGGTTGINGTHVNDGGLYDPLQDVWRAISRTGAPSPREGEARVWTGRELIVWGGNSSGYGHLDTGARYEPATDTWRPVSTTGAPSPRTMPLALWTGSRMIVWSGEQNTIIDPFTGGVYDPSNDTWTPMTTTGAPVGRLNASTVWTGREMLVWGGSDHRGKVLFNDGGLYDPVSDVWRSTSMTGAPLPRQAHSTIWTGAMMLVWGGSGPGATYHNSGGRFDPATNQWRPMTISGAPVARYHHTSLWTGELMIVWGGQQTVSGTTTIFASGGAYDPAHDSWQATSLAGAPAPRTDHTAVWTGSEMIVFGGGPIEENDGGQLGIPPQVDADGDGVTACAGDCDETRASVHSGAPQICGDGLNNDCRHTSWPYPGGTNEADDDYDSFTECSGDCNDAAFAVHPRAPETCDRIDNDCDDEVDEAADEDADGFTVCTGDCDDTRNSVHAGAPQICGDGLNNDCALPSWPALAGTNEFDDDGDGVTECAGDCNDTTAGARPGAAEICDRIDNDCDSEVDEGPDADGDSFTPCGGDCDDTRGSIHPGAPQICDGLNDDCADPHWPSVAGTNESDEDGDGLSECGGDCADGAAATYPGAVEVNDGADNQCAGEEGHGLRDEVASDAGFSEAGPPWTFCWTPQPGASGYLLARAGSARFDSECHRDYTTSTCLEDPDAPAPGGIFYYLVRAEGPRTGSWGQDSSGTELEDVCGGPASTFGFEDSPGDDIAPTSLRDFFEARSPTPSDFIFFEIRRGGLEGEAWCAPRADFYADSYLGLAGDSGFAYSGAWERWARVSPSSAWVASTGSRLNYYGSSCRGTWSWCSESGLLTQSLWIIPSHIDFCEAYVENLGCGMTGGWTLTLRIGANRQAACGF